MNEKELTPGAGGFVVPPEFAERIMELKTNPEALKEYNRCLKAHWQLLIEWLASWEANRLLAEDEDEPDTPSSVPWV